MENVWDGIHFLVKQQPMFLYQALIADAYLLIEDIISIENNIKNLNEKLLQENISMGLNFNIISYGCYL